MSLTSINCEHIAPALWGENTFQNLQRQEVHLWRIDLRIAYQKLSKLEKLLSYEERKRAANYLQEKDRIRFILGHACVKDLISRYLDIDVAQVSLNKGANGKPYISPVHKLYFNISHSGDWVLIAFGSEELGVDLENITGDFITDPLMAQCFHENEIKVIRTSDDPTAEFFKFWTRKEAFLKATGNGMVDELNQFTCMNAFQEFEFPSLSNKKNWYLKSFLMDNNYAVSLCAPSPLNTILFLNY
ncbi:4'-phosphopantetheinyl transferase superfamily protein [uncultured Cyclobacterium sp.]|uniref:4'-phosphopantetheinyl transferase family protein n=1 Tax=uncultured Cyclobacterium sp. TaxID=453820 RepID=UPI0030EC6644|tara:strand:+ start:23306 stop:24037 length:732 start_codon:yes stop_codon:yes gene_type:complete